MQFHQAMEPILSYLGVHLISRNLAHGGLGTLESSMGAGSIYGNEIDILLWDSGMTEGRDYRALDMFMRQGLIGGNRVPFLFNGNLDLLKRYHNEIDVDVGVWGTADLGIPTIMNITDSTSVPYAARWMKCSQELSQECRAHKFNANCWVDRPDVQPPKKQQEHPGSQVKWHPGYCWHQLTGRILAFWTLHALDKAIAKWSQADNFILQDKDWHVTAYYDNIRAKLKSSSASWPCFSYQGTIPTRVCSTPMKALTEFTPRANPLQTAITSIVRPDPTGYIPFIKDQMLYEGPDVHNPLLDIPEGEVDLLAILNNGRQIPEQMNQRRLAGLAEPTENVLRRTANNAIVPGKGFELIGEPAGYCDGSWNMICHREPNNDCLLSGHADSRAGILFDSLSGWLVMDVPKVKEGLIVIKMETWHQGVGRTSKWTTVNNERKLQPPYCNDFKFEFAINGNVTTWSGEEDLLKHRFQLQRVVEVFVLLDDEDWSEEKDVELAVRMTGCGAGANNAKTFSLTHIYWA